MKGKRKTFAIFNYETGTFLRWQADGGVFCDVEVPTNMHHLWVLHPRKGDPGVFSIKAKGVAHHLVSQPPGNDTRWGGEVCAPYQQPEAGNWAGGRLKA